MIDKLNAAVVDALADTGVRSRLADVGQEIPPREQQTPEALAAFTQAEIAKWWPIIKAANIKGEKSQNSGELRTATPVLRRDMLPRWHGMACP